jgi:hypothetical protein
VRNLAGVTLTPIGLLLALLGLLHYGARRHWAWLVAMAILVVLMPRKFHEMNYYYLVILPPLCVLAGLGWQLVALRWRPSWRAVAALILIGAAFSLRLTIKPAFVTPEEDLAVVPAAAVVQTLTAAEEPVATLHGTTLDLLYYCDRPGWALSCEKPNLADRLRQCREQGARLLVVAGLERLDEPARQVIDALPFVQRGDDFAILRLSGK